MEIQLGAVKRIHGLLKTEAESYEGLLGEGCRRASGERARRRGPGGSLGLGYSWIPAVALAWWLTPSPAPSTLADPQELAGPREDPDPEPECALRQLPEARAEACQRPHLPRTEGQGGGHRAGHPTGSPRGPPGSFSSHTHSEPQAPHLTWLSPPLPSLPLPFSSCCPHSLTQEDTSDSPG